VRNPLITLPTHIYSRALKLTSPTKILREQLSLAPILMLSLRHF
jgi:hypothetical protein